MGRHVLHMETKNVCNVLDVKPEKKRLLIKPMCRWENYIKMDFREIWFEDTTLLMWIIMGTSAGLL